MKILVVVVLIIGLLFFACNQKGENGLNSDSVFTPLNGPYLGQKPPGTVPEVFAPNILSAGEAEYKITFSPDGMAFCYNLSTPKAQWIVEPVGLFKKSFMMYTCVEAGHWTEPKELPFDLHLDKHYPFFSPDGQRLYYNDIKDGAPRKMVVEREKEDWSDPRELEFEGEFQRDGLFMSIASNGNLYFGMSPDGENTFIYFSKYENGVYRKPVMLRDVIAEAGGGHHPYIAPDESYLIFDYRTSNNGTGEEDLYISFRDPNGKWMKPINMGKGVNTAYREKRAFVSFDGKYLFFISNRINAEIPERPLTLSQVQRLTRAPKNSFQHIYWVDAKVIEDLRPK